MLLVEEPETGLHPAAQRKLAASLRQWATHGLQLVLVTHSPAFVNAAEPQGIRLARREAGDGARSAQPAIIRPTDLGEIRDSLGVQPSDILLSRRFVIVEGPSDQLALEAWARRLGHDLRGQGIQLVPSFGFGLARQVARFLALAYEGAEFFVVLDNGSDTAKAKLEIDEQFGGRVRTRMLSRTEIEGYFDQGSIADWLRLAGVLDEDLDQEVAYVFSSTKNAVSALGQLSTRYRGKPYEKVLDGLAIANLMSEAVIDPEIKGLLQEIGAD